jgi:hypothetical protein
MLRGCHDLSAPFLPFQSNVAFLIEPALEQGRVPCNNGLGINYPVFLMAKGADSFVSWFR